MAVVPYLLNNSEVWVNLDKECMEEMDKLQTLFLSVLMAVPVSCPRPALSWDTGTLSMSNRIIQRKLNLVVHIKNLKEDALAKQVFLEQRNHGWPGLVSEAQDLCKKVNLQDITVEREGENKQAWKINIRRAVEKINGKELGDEINKVDKYQKLTAMKTEEYGQKEYLEEMDINKARLFFRMRTKMIKCCMNQSSDAANRAALWKCLACGYVDSQSHLLHCPAFQDLRIGKSLDSDLDLVDYFTKVLKMRENLNV